MTKAYETNYKTYGVKQFPSASIEQCLEAEDTSTRLSIAWLSSYSA